MHLQDLLQRLEGVKASENGYMARCPAHEDRHSSLALREADGKLLLHCHAGCGYEAVLSALNLQARDLFTQEANGLKSGKSGPSQVYAYCDAQGALLYEVCRFEDAQGKTFRQRHYEGGHRVWNMKGIEPVLYHLDKVRAHIETGDGIVYLCEGEKDADALCALGFCASTSPMGAGKWSDAYSAMLEGARLVYLLPDHDEAGHAHMRKVADALLARAMPVIWVDLAKGYAQLAPKGDVSDVLEQGGVDLLLDCLEKAQVLQAPKAPDRTLSGYLQEEYWAEMHKQSGHPKLSTGFASLDAQMDGRMYPGLYVIGSVSSLGKTAFVGQMADNIAAQGRDVLFFTLEMSRYEMVSRALIRELFLQDAARYIDKNMGHVYYGVLEPSLLRAAADRYAARVGKHISYIEGNLEYDVHLLVKHAHSHREARGVAPVIFVDYLQVLTSPDPRMSDKQAVDHNVLSLKRLARDLDTPVVVVSSFNRQSYQEDVSFASFKESGAIEYSADFVLGLQAAGVAGESESAADDRKLSRAVAKMTRDAKGKDPRPIEAITLKNRRGRAQARFDLLFFPKQNYFKEPWSG